MHSCSGIGIVNGAVMALFWNRISQSQTYLLTLLGRQGIFTSMLPPLSMQAVKNIYQTNKTQLLPKIHWPICVTTGSSGTVCLLNNQMGTGHELYCGNSCSARTNI